MGRPKLDEGEGRTERVVLRVRPDEHERWTRAATRAGMTLSEWIRGLVEGAATARKGKRR